MPSERVHVRGHAASPGRPKPGYPMHESPLPGDLVICPQPAPRGARRYAVVVWPDLDAVAQIYETYEYALQQARNDAGVRAVAVWRNHSFDLQKPALENVTSD